MGERDCTASLYSVEELERAPGTWFGKPAGQILLDQRKA
jgi:hypothetical protein